MSRPAAILDAARCPLCGQANQCALEVERATGLKQPPCWCTQVDFNREVLERLPPEARGAGLHLPGLRKPGPRRRQTVQNSPCASCLG